MTAPSLASPASATVASGPCGAPRVHVEGRCAEADRLAAAAAEHQQRLRDARLDLSEVVRQRERDAASRDRRSLNDAKDEARHAYRAALARATGPGEVQAAAGEWLTEINRLNRQVRGSERNSDEVVRRATEIEGAMPGIELAADAARIAAESAQAACLEARRELAACEEEAHRRVAVGGRARQRPAQSSGVMPATVAATVSTRSSSQAGSQLSALLRGDRQRLLGLALRLSEDTGMEAGRLHLLLLELREAIAARALEEHSLRFPDGHPFWGQFEGEEASCVVTSLAALGYRFDGRDGWADDRGPTARDLALALSHSDLDPRSFRRPAGQAAIDELWQGTVVLTEAHLRSCAPNLTVEQVVGCLGPRAARLGELWDTWGRIRPVLIGTA